MNDATYRYKIETNHKGHATEFDMGMFGFLFLERTEDNYKKYIKNIEFNGVVNDPETQKIFFESQPIFDGFKDFENQC